MPPDDSQPDANSSDPRPPAGLALLRARLAARLRASPRGIEEHPRGFGLFSLVLVVLLAGVAAAVVLPILAQRRNSYHGSCYSHLHQIGIALKLYRQDNRFCPADTTEWDGTGWWGTFVGGKSQGDGKGLGALYPDYISAERTFNCPSHWMEDPRDPAFFSFDGQDPAKHWPDNVLYLRVWKWDGADPDAHERRQLIWRNPDETTVVTWCRFHRAHPDATTVLPTDKDLILYLDARVELVPSSRTGHAMTVP